MFLNVQVKQVQAFKLHMWHCFLFQAFICIIVITFVGGRSLAAAPDSYQMRPVLLPSSFFCCELPKLAHLSTVQNLGECRRCAVLNNTFYWMLPGQVFEEKEKIMGENQYRFILADQTLFLWHDALLLTLLQSAPISVSTEHPYYFYVLGWSHVRVSALLAVLANELNIFPDNSYNSQHIYELLFCVKNIKRYPVLKPIRSFSDHALFMQEL